MRLTLRTLLAYLDDILQPGEAKELGKKIAESPFAATLANRIREVVRRRRVGAPEVSGPGSSPDANIIAEYLDNTLAPEKVADVERICLESDAHLAEVAACHQILTNVLGEPVEVPANMRQRMYALGTSGASVEEADTNGTRRPESPAPPLAPLAPVRDGSGSDLQTMTAAQPLVADREALPEALRKGTSGRKMLAVAALGLLLAGWAGLMFSDPTWRSVWNLASQSPPATEEVVQDREQLPVVRPADAAIEIAVPAPLATGKHVPPVTQTEVASSDAPLTSADMSRRLPDDVMPADELVATPPPLPADVEPFRRHTSDDTHSPIEVPIAGATGELARVESPEVTTAEAVVPVAPVPAAPVLPQPLQVQYVSSEGVLLHLPPDAPMWAVLPRRSLIYPGEEVASPQPFDSHLVVSSGELEVLLRGGSRVTSLGSTPDTRFGLEVNRGRVVVQLTMDPSANIGVMSLRVRGQRWFVELLEAGTVFGIEVTPLPPVTEDDQRGAGACEGGVFVVRGSARLTRTDGQAVHELGRGAEWLPWSFTEGQPAVASALQAFPEWTDLQAGGPSAVQRRYLTLYEKEFVPDATVEDSIAPVVKDRQPRLAELAAQTMALTDNVSGLVSGLSSEHEEVRLASIAGLRDWLPRLPENDALLLQTLQSFYREEDAKILLRLLWGYSARMPRTSSPRTNWWTGCLIPTWRFARRHTSRSID